MGENQNNRIRIPTAMKSNDLFHYRADRWAAGEMSDMGTHQRVRKSSVFISWLALALYIVSIYRGDVLKMF